jgi:hypothetical protein
MVLTAELGEIDGDADPLQRVTLEGFVDIQEFCLGVPAGVERPAVPRGEGVKHLLLAGEAQRSQFNRSFRESIPTCPREHVACPCGEECLVGTLPGHALV